ncbi:MAG: VTT domain-containing protein [Gemmatimonadales bacterium]
MLALLAAVENLVPLVPADLAAALGAFLSTRGVVRAELVLAITVLANVSGAALVYILARGPGRRWLQTRAGRKLLSPRAFVVMEREYLRLGVGGIFVARLLPGIRAAVPPFAGLAGIRSMRALLPVLLAAVLWYGGITLLGVTLGANWPAISRALSGVNRTLAIVAVVALVVGILVARRRRRQRRDALWAGVRSAFAEAGGGDPEAGLHAVAPLVLELVCADEALEEPARDELLANFRRRWRIPGVFTGRRFDDLLGQAARLRETYGPAERRELATRMWRVLAHEGDLEASDHRMMERAGELLGLGRTDMEAARQAAGERAS